MTRSVAPTLIAMVVIAGFAVPGHASTINISGTFSGDPTLTPNGTPGVFVQNLTGDGDDTIYGSFTPTSQSTVSSAIRRTYLFQVGRSRRPLPKAPCSAPATATGPPADLAPRRLRSTSCSRAEPGSSRGTRGKPQ